MEPATLLFSKVLFKKLSTCGHMSSYRTTFRKPFRRSFQGIRFNFNGDLQNEKIQGQCSKFDIVSNITITIFTKI